MGSPHGDDAQQFAAPCEYECQKPSFDVGRGADALLAKTRRGCQHHRPAIEEQPSVREVETAFGQNPLTLSGVPIELHCMYSMWRHNGRRQDFTGERPRARGDKKASINSTLS